MKIAITAQSNNTEALFDQRFGRAEYFCVYNSETQTSEFVNNENIKASNGAGTKVAELMAELGVGKVISGDFGPKAKELLDKLNIQMVIITDEGQSVATVIQKIK
ncbi:NifB/NifX family molybdenum-iron cluster-binding protein [Saccharicrinis aurantiacus]|uniref:NifB/NifX family molybdenum-iron cluster-binding protein n=1 Tax=Saccharicrinis aurantiacus TaxID=1849719 RepID=UPI0024935661|nr:NifB/NifX family molybdenum-iron cluster-binding protein [Saccharicrinis aurantiacus]